MTLSKVSLSSVWQRPDAWHCPTVLWVLGVATLLLYVGLRVLWPSVGSVAETSSALLGLLAVLAYGKGLRSSGPLWLLLAALLVQCLSWWLGYLHHPQWVADNPQLDRLAKLFIFIAVAWWLGGSTRNTMWLWGLASLAYLVATLMLEGAFEDWLIGLGGTRVDFGIRNAQHSSMMFGVMLLGLVILAPRLLRAGNWRWLRGGLWLCVVLIALTAVLIGQTRAVWLALCLALPLVLITWLAYQWVHQGGVSLQALGLASVVALLLAGLVAAALHEPLVKRLAEESVVTERILEGRFDEIPYTSVGNRINTWRAAVEWIAERPLVGWGGEGRSLVIEHTPWLPDHVKAEYGHLHNYFLEIWVAYGLLGVAVIAGLAWWVGQGCWRSWRAGVLPGDLTLFGMAFFVYWVVVNQFESYNSFWTGVYVHNLILGGLVTHIWRWQRQQAALREKELATRQPG